MRNSLAKFLCVFGFLLFGGLLRASGQVAPGTPTFGSFGGGPDIVDLANNNVHLSIPVFSKAGRGTPFSYTLTYDSSIWYPVTSGSTTSWQPIESWGWGQIAQAETGYVTYSVLQEDCYTGKIPTGVNVFYENWVFYDSGNVAHPIPGEIHIETGTCGNINTEGFTATATDGSGYTVTTAQDGASVFVTSRYGDKFVPPVNQTTGTVTSTDRNGNEITVSSSNVFTDTLGTTALSVSGVAPSNTLYTYTPPSGTNVSYKVEYGTYNVLTNFGCSGISEYSASSVYLIDEIVLPDNSTYTFSYEQTPGHSGYVTGRLAAVKLPQGGTISYTYSGGSNGLVCADGSAATLTRTTPDGTWKYAHSESGTAWATTVTDPQSNQTTLDFQGLYVTERQVHQGGTLLKTTYTCYNGASAPCNSTAISLPITERTRYVQWPGGLESKTDYQYNTYGLITEEDEYAYGSGGPGAVVRKTLTTYASLSNSIEGMPATVTVEDGSGNVKAQTTYTYDQGSVVTTSGTPQHVSVSGSRGNATTISNMVSSGSSLSKTFTYFDTGNIDVATDVNGAQTTYTYGACGNSFPTSVSEPMSLSRSMAWNCTGGVETSVTDENGHTSSASYTDPDFWRPASNTDQLGNVTYYSYQPNPSYSSPFMVASSLTFNGGSSIVSNVLYEDDLGRPYDDQHQEYPGASTLDTTSFKYDANGRSYSVSGPCAVGYVGSCSGPTTTQTYDALNRPLVTTDGGGGTVSLTYTQNDTYQSVGPAPSGENAKRKQVEYDALGRVTSVCEITSAAGSGTCGQTSPATGYWTKYSYDVLNDLVSVTQNAQSSQPQTRTYAYDGLGRMTSETNPESGTTTYYHDSIPSGCYDAGLSSPGDTTAISYAAGNLVCTLHDALHRITSTGSGSVCKRFYYDSATVDGTTMLNAKGHLAEESTDNCAGTKITDTGFSYDARGEATGTWESTPNSGGYYHVTESYWANGAVNSIGGLPGLPTVTYNVDGEGRPYSASASSGQNPLASTSYNTASLPTQVNFGSSDSDAFTYDPNTFRMTQYRFNVNGQSVIGALTWNAIGTLKSLAITDPFNSANAQTCAYSHDDLTRIASANCGSVWSQTFSYDAFGNLNKSGTNSFQPTYSYLTNHMTEIGSSVPSYDGNGDVTNDFLHTYSWDTYGQLVTVDGVWITRDALGRAAEEDNGGAYSQIVYAPSGAKLALMNGQTLTRAYVPLSGGSVAVYNSSGLAYYRQADWLGSSRFASTPSRTMYYDGAYAPFGESYAETGSADRSFTGMNQDTVSALYDFPAREYGIQGRWPSPDPAGMSAVDPSDPQTWNRYAYVRNSPLALRDPTGEVICQGGEDEDSSDSGGECDEDGPDGPGSLFGQESGNLWDWVSSGPAPDPSPNQGYYQIFGNEFDSLENPCSGECRYQSLISSAHFDPEGVGNPGGSTDPCVYLNDAGNGIEQPIDYNSSPGECQQTGGQWVPPGAGIVGVDENGNVVTTQIACTSEGCMPQGFSFFTKTDVCHVFAIAGLAGLLAIPGADIPSGAAWALYGTGGASAIAGVSLCW